ncbi:hypothetical protein OG372_25825 [Streptomyces sp. NBC_01020]|uniref:hypothetical protein n=1 Tax=unclassified Streptomyces TaxID=2593676 RepID=UPI002E2455AD|nr:hypothetical protein OG372_25825 [Streptomyces sp. NBC_01020]WSX44833.1 hypothetical protein OG760_25800 [Streptomyces sp. NBC_00963]WSX67151.1 hypothetical protein OG221_11290 [Streptomyces sp. NBC_00932]
MNDVVWLHHSLPRTAWFDLEPAARERYEQAFQEQRDASERLGGRGGGRFHVRGQSDYSQVEIWFFPTAEQAFDHWSRLVTAGYTTCFEFSNQVGQADPADAPFT